MSRARAAPPPAGQPAPAASTLRAAYLEHARPPLAAPPAPPRQARTAFSQALVPCPLERRPQLASHASPRFVPRAAMSPPPAPASLLRHDLPVPELYYLVAIELLASRAHMPAAYRCVPSFARASPRLARRFAHKLRFCQSRRVRAQRVRDKASCHGDRLAGRSQDNHAALACAERAICGAFSASARSSNPVGDHVDVPLVYKRDARVGLARLDDRDGWTDEELCEKKRKARIAYEPMVLLPAQVAALYSNEGIRLYSCDGRLTVLRETPTAQNAAHDEHNDLTFADGVAWTELRPALETCGPRLQRTADRLLLALLVAGQVRLSGYFCCVDAAESRHVTHSTRIFMDAPLWVLAFKLSEKQVSFRNDSTECLLIPVGPACTIIMRYVTAKYFKIHGRVYHSEHVIVMPYGCRLGDRQQLQWYAVGASPWEAADHPPHALVEVAEAQLAKLSCSASAERDHIVISARKGLASVRLRDIGFEAGWSSWSPHLIVTGRGKRVTASVRAHSLTHLVDVLRRIRDKSKETPSYSIQEIAGIMVLGQVLTGPLYLTACPSGLEWAPEWKKVEQGFVVPHSICLPRGVGVRQINKTENRVGVLISRDTMAIFEVRGEQDGTWDLSFLELDAGIASEKLVVSPRFEGFVSRLIAGRMGVPQGRMMKLVRSSESCESLESGGGMRSRSQSRASSVAPRSRRGNITSDTGSECDEASPRNSGNGDTVYQM